MTWLRYLPVSALIICLISLAFHFTRLLRIGVPKDYSRQRGDLTSALAYSFLGAMSPTKKESAFFHLPTYVAGLLYHAGTFVSITLFFVFFEVVPGGLIRTVLVLVLAASVLSGTGILVKRTVLSKLRSLSNPDDYISNILVTVFHVSTAVVLVEESINLFYVLSATLLLLYIPLGKLKHLLYFFAARYHLGFFYGWRGIWPSIKS